MTKDHLLQHIELMTPEQINFIGNIIKFANTPDYNTYINLAGITEAESRKIDSAYPAEYAKQIREIYPDFVRGQYVYDYNRETFGEMVNLNNLVVQNLKTVLKINF